MQAGAAQVSGLHEFGLLMQMFLFPLVCFLMKFFAPLKKKSHWGKTVGRLIIQYTKFSNAPWAHLFLPLCKIMLAV